MKLLAIIAAAAVIGAGPAACAPSTQKQAAVKKPDAVVCLIGIDGTGSYQYLEKAKQTAIRIIGNLPGNSKVYVRWITHDSLDDRCSIVSALLPEVVKPANPYDVVGKRKYAAQLARDRQARAELARAIRDARSPAAGRTDIYGALYSASVRFSGAERSRPLLILLTDMDDNAGRKNVYHFRLDNAAVKIMDFQAGGNDDLHRRVWQDYLAERGASSVEFIPLDEPAAGGRL